MPRKTGRFAMLLVGVSWIVVPAFVRAGPFDQAGHDPASAVAWATAVDSFDPGPRDIAAPEMGLADFGLPEYSLGPATEDLSDVVSLGDGGSVTLAFASGIRDGPGDDFAVWENGFFSIGGLFAEFAFVEVSTDGVEFARFESTALNPVFVESFDTVDPTDYYNLAGDQSLGWGTGFDLGELRAHPLVESGVVDLDHVRYVRVVDVVGDGSTLDAMGRSIYDPYPSPFSAGGFDLEAIGVMHGAPEPGLTPAILVGTFGLVRLSRRRARRSPCSRQR